MAISVTLDTDFERYFNVLKEEFGEDFSIINGLSDDKLSYSDFLDNFVAKKTVADASVDGSSNVHSKDIVTMRSEMSKPHEKLLALSKIFQKMRKKYGLRTEQKPVLHRSHMSSEHNLVKNHFQIKIHAQNRTLQMPHWYPYLPAEIHLSRHDSPLTE